MSVIREFIAHDEGCPAMKWWESPIPECECGYDKALADLDAMEDFEALMPCGHKGRYAVQTNEGTGFCLFCEYEALMKCPHTSERE